MSQRSATPRTTAPSLYFRVPPEPSHLLRARERIRDYLEQHCSERQVSDDLVMCIEEAATNVIRHSGSDEQFEISLRFADGDLVAEVRDHGAGFEIARFDPDIVPDVSRDHGRGLFLISHLCDEMELRRDGGLEVRMIKKAVASCETATLESGLAFRAAGDASHRDERLRVMLEEIDEAFIALDWEYRFAHVNAATLRILDRTRDEVVGRRAWDIWPAPEDTAATLAIREAMELGRPGLIEYRAADSGDWLEVHVYPTPAGVSLYLREINERKRVEEALRDAEAKSADLVRYAPTGIYEIDFRGPRFRTVNDAMCALSGYERDELLAMDPFDLLDDDSRTVFAERLRGALAGEPIPDSVEYRFRTKDGRLRDVVLNTSFTETDGVVSGALVVGYDVTERKQAQTELRESEERFRSLFESTAEGIALHEVIYDGDGRAVDYRIIDVNPSFESQTGIVAHDARGRLASELYGTGEAPYLAEYARVADGAGPSSLETYFAPLGRHFRITATSPARGRFATVFEDITESKRAEEALRRSEERLRQELETTVLLSEAVGSLTLSLSPTEVLDRLARIVLEVGDHTRVTVSLWQEGTQSLLVASALGEASVPVGLVVALEELSEPARRAISERRSTLIDYDALEPGRRGVGDTVTSHLAFNVPLYAGDRFVGLLAADDPSDRREFSARERSLIEGVGAQAAIALENARLHDELTHREHFNAALNEINGLIHSTLRAEEVMQRVVAYAVDVVGADSAMVALRHGDDWVAEYGHPEVPGVIHESVRSDEAPFMITAATQRVPVAIDDCETDPRCIPEVQRRFGVRSVLCIPLVARDEVLGVIFFNHHRAAVRFEPQTVDFAGKLAVAISSALENARMYEEQQHIAQTLQENFVHELPEVAGLELGVVSKAAHEPELVGGDFSDVFVVDDAHVVALIGDVAGKGVKAAGMTETVRSTVRALAVLDPSPTFILGKTNELLLRFDADEPHVTAFVAVLDPHTGRLTYASAGHPAPVHLGAVSARLLDVSHGPPLGSFERPYEGAQATLTHEDHLVLYTDGVTEARRDGTMLGEQRLLEIVSGLRGRSAQEIADGVRDAALAFADRLRDDLQVVVLRLA